MQKIKILDCGDLTMPFAFMKLEKDFQDFCAGREIHNVNFQNGGFREKISKKYCKCCGREINILGKGGK